MKTINSFRSKLFALTCALMASVSSFAYDEMPDFQVDGLYYNFLEGDNVEVTHPYRPEMPTEGTSTTATQDLYDDYAELTELTIPSTISYEGKVYNVIRIGYAAFDQCNLTYVDIPSSIKTIGVAAFSNCSSLTSITLKEGLEHIEGNAFDFCSLLESITIPNSVQTIGEYAFSDCRALTSIICQVVEPLTIHSNVFWGVSIANATLYVPAESVEAYKNADQWKDFQIRVYYGSEECDEYQHVNLTALPLITGKLTYRLSTDDGSEIPYVDSVWILNTDKEPLQKFYAQSGDTIDILSLERGHYILRVYIDGCILSRNFVHRPKWRYTWCDTWNVMWFDGMRFDETASTSQYRLGKDTVIGDYRYSKFTSRTSVRFTDDRKVYVYYEGFDDNDPYSEDLPTGEYLAYDFSAQVGDTLEVFSGIGTYSTYSCVVYDVEIAPSPSVVDDAQTDSEPYLRIIKLHPLCDVDGESNMEISSEEITWIEGVGSPNGFLISDLPGRAGGGLFTLLCAYKDDELKYTGSFYEHFGCEYNAGVVSDDLFSTLSGLQRTICREYYEQADNKTRMEQFTNLTTRTETGAPYIYCSPFLLREKDNKILIYSRSLNKDLVLYDFNLQVGDSLPMLYIDFFAKDDWIADSDMEIWCIVDYHKDLEGNILPADTLIVTDVSAITLLDGKEYKKWTFNNGMEYVEGIGSFGNRQWSGDFFQLIANRDVPTSLQGEHLVCVSKNNKLLYQMDDTEMERLGAECLCEAENPEDLFPTLWGLQRTEVEYHTDGADAPSLVSFEEYTPTLVNGKWYLYDGRNYLREENNQVLLYSPEFEIYEDVVLYDWALEIGDTLPFTIRPFDDDKMRGAVFRVTDVSTITLLDGKEYKKWTLACGIEYIEGIGAINGEGFGNYFCIQHTAHPATYIDTRLVCASRNGQLLYQMDEAEMERLGAECLCEAENPEDLFPTLWGLQRTGCTKTIGENGNGTTVWGSRSYLMQEIETATIDGKQYLLFGIDNNYDKLYLKLWLREENNKILLYSTAQKKDLVLYDFTLNVGDSLPRLYVDYDLSSVVDYDNDEWGLSPLVVTEVSTITLLDGKEYKKWTFDNGMQYVEGIGSIGTCYAHNDFYQLIANAPLSSDVYSQYLVCASKNGKLLYQMDDAEMERLGAECLCDYDSGHRKDNAKDGQIGGRPTPTQWNQLELDLREMENGNTILRAETFSYTLENESIVANGKTYYQLARQSTKDTATTKSFVGALHFGEDEDNRVYFLRDGVEYVLYDFTAEPGDTVEIFAGINNYPQETTYTHVVTGKDTLENGACRMLLEVVFPNETATAENAEKVWLAGLGSVDGIVHNAAKRTSNAHAAPNRSADSNETESSVMLCAWREDSCLYTTDHPDYDSFGCVYNQDPTSIEDTHSPSPIADYQKLLHNGQLLIIHNGKTYNVLGIAVE